MGDTELKVLPREPTDYWLAKSLLLGVLFWLFTVATELGVLFIPLFFGKLIWFSLQLPDSLRHDPLCYGIGVFTFIGGYQAFVQASRRIDLSLLRAALWGLPLSTAKTGTVNLSLLLSLVLVII